MAVIGPPYSGPRNIHYLFVDAGSLRGKLDNFCKKFYQNQGYHIDYNILSGPYTKTFYYDAVPVMENGESDDAYRARIAPITARLDAASNVDGVHVYEGDVRKRRGRNEQKKVDIMIAVDMLTHTFRRNMHEATLLTGDSDFKPLVDALVQNGMFVTLWYPHNETSKELHRAADRRRALNIRDAWGLLTRESQAVIDMPQHATQHVSSDFGIILKQWNEGGTLYSLYKRDMLYFVLKQASEIHVDVVYHHNYELLKYYCKDVIGIEVPDI